MNITMPVRQHGFTLGGIVFGAFVLVILSITGLKLVPAYIEYAKIKTVFAAMSQDPTMIKAGKRDIRDSFSRRASVDDIKVITPEDIEIESVDGKTLLSANYSVKIPIGGNVSILLDFNPTSGE